MPFASINPIITQGPIHEFFEKKLRIGGFEKLSFFESAILNIVFQKRIEWMGLNFLDYDGLQPKLTHTIH